jgi:mRNA interferase MazF
MTPIFRGDVVLVRFPNTDLQTYKLRPALIIQADGLQTGHDDRIVAMITSRMHRAGPSCVPVRRSSDLGRAMGLLTDSVVVLHRIATIQGVAIDWTIGSCPDMESIDAALRVALGSDA